MKPIFGSRLWTDFTMYRFTEQSLRDPRCISITFQGKPEVWRYKRIWYSGTIPKLSEQVRWGFHNFECKDEEQWMRNLLSDYVVKFNIDMIQFSDEKLPHLYKQVFGCHPPRYVAEESLLQFPLYTNDTQQLVAKKGLILPVVTLSRIES